MEDFIGIMIFVLFMVLRTTKDRKKGMSRNKTDGTPRTRTSVETQSPVERKNAGRQVVRSDGAGLPPAKGLVQESHLEKAPLVREPLLAEGQSYFQSLPPMEGISLQKEEEPPLEDTDMMVQDIVTLTSASDLSFTPQNLKDAVLWSEILQAPRFRTSALSNRFMP